MATNFFSLFAVVLFHVPINNGLEYNVIFNEIANSFLDRLELDKHSFCSPDPDICRNASELITSKGYPCEDHIVQTADGFLLGVQRMPHGRHQVLKKNRPVVFLQHGLLSSSVCWISNLANESLGFILADAGYDVWLGNVRGNTYSRQHKKLKPDQAQFWAWSWDEMTAYDIPAMIDYILKATGESQLYYIGHSQGTLVAMTAFSQDSRLSDKIKLFIGLGPVATVGHIEGAMAYLTYIVPELKDLFSLLGVNEFLPNTALMKFLASTLCHEKVSREICENIIFLIGGPETTNLNVSRLPVYISHSPAGTSVQNMVHFGQMVKSGLCQMYDYGSKDKNLEHYGQTKPPVYDLTRMQVPAYLFSAEKDILSDPKDVAALLRTLPNIQHHEQIQGWNHLDFVWAYDAAHTLYKNLLHILETHPIHTI